MCWAREEGGELREVMGVPLVLSAQPRGRSLLWACVGGKPSSWSALLSLGVFPLCVQLMIWSLAGSCQYWSSLRQPEAEQCRVHQWKLKWQVLHSGGVWVFGTELHFPVWPSVQLNCCVNWAYAYAQNSLSVPFYRKINFISWEGSAISLPWPDESRCSLKAELVTLLLEWF